MVAVPNKAAPTTVCRRPTTLGAGLPDMVQTSDPFTLSRLCRVRPVRLRDARQRHHPPVSDELTNLAICDVHVVTNRREARDVIRSTMMRFRRPEPTGLHRQVVASVPDLIRGQHTGEFMTSNPGQSAVTIAEHTGREPSTLTVKDPDHVGPPRVRIAPSTFNRHAAMLPYEPRRVSPFLRSRVQPAS